MFMSCVRRVQRLMERRTGVRPSVSDSVTALHTVLGVRYDTGEPSDRVARVGRSSTTRHASALPSARDMKGMMKGD